MIKRRSIRASTVLLRSCNWYSVRGNYILETNSNTRDNSVNAISVFCQRCSSVLKRWLIIWKCLLFIFFPLLSHIIITVLFQNSTLIFLFYLSNSEFCSNKFFCILDFKTNSYAKIYFTIEKFTLKIEQLPSRG